MSDRCGQVWDYDRAVVLVLSTRGDFPAGDLVHAAVVLHDAQGYWDPGEAISLAELAYQPWESIRENRRVT